MQGLQAADGRHDLAVEDAHRAHQHVYDHPIRGTGWSTRCASLLTSAVEPASTCRGLDRLYVRFKGSGRL